MKVFISWSGTRSKAVAEILSDWVKCVIQATRPWLSTRDIDRGSLWFSEINDQLRDTSVGIVCLTQENKNRPWILFEAGALAKGLSSNRVCTFLIDLKSSDLQDPLAQFNHTYPEKTSLWELVRTLNGSLTEGALDDRILRQVFETYWDQFNSKFAAALKEFPAAAAAEPRKESDVLAEVLENTRYLQSRMRRIENRIGPVEESSSAGDFSEPFQFTDEALDNAINNGLNFGLSSTDIIHRMRQMKVPASVTLRRIARLKRTRALKEPPPNAPI